MLVLPIVSFGKQTGLIMHLNIKYYKCCQLALRAIIWDVWGHYMAFLCFLPKNVLFAITAVFLSFPDKNLWFSSQRRREGVVGDANDSISK